jgi:hypothetical protein
MGSIPMFSTNILRNIKMKITVQWDEDDKKLVKQLNFVFTNVYTWIILYVVGFFLSFFWWAKGGILECNENPGCINMEVVFSAFLSLIWPFMVPCYIVFSFFKWIYFLVN